MAQIQLGFENRDPFTGETRTQIQKMLSFAQGIVDLATLGIAAKAPGSSEFSKWLLWSFIDLSAEEVLPKVAKLAGLDNDQGVILGYYMSVMCGRGYAGEFNNMQKVMMELLDKGVKGCEFLEAVRKAVNIPEGQKVAVDLVEVQQRAVEQCQGK